MNIDMEKVKDYGTTMAFFAVAAIVAYQGPIMAQIPQEYGLLALIIFGILSQVAADKRVKVSVDTVNGKIDEAQTVADGYKVKYEEAMMKLDEAQAEINRVTELRKMTEAAVLDGA